MTTNEMFAQIIAKLEEQHALLRSMIEPSAPSSSPSTSALTADTEAISSPTVSSSTSAPLQKQNADPGFPSPVTALSSTRDLPVITNGAATPPPLLSISELGFRTDITNGPAKQASASALRSVDYGRTDRIGDLCTARGLPFAHLVGKLEDRASLKVDAAAKFLADHEPSVHTSARAWRPPWLHASRSSPSRRRCSSSQDSSAYIVEPALAPMPALTLNIIIRPYDPSVRFAGVARVGVCFDAEEAEHARVALTLGLLHRSVSTPADPFVQADRTGGYNQTWNVTLGVPVIGASSLRAERAWGNSDIGEVYISSTEFVSVMHTKCSMQSHGRDEVTTPSLCAFFFTAVAIKGTHHHENTSELLMIPLLLEPEKLLSFGTLKMAITGLSPILVEILDSQVEGNIIELRPNPWPSFEHSVSLIYRLSYMLLYYDTNLQQLGNFPGFSVIWHVSILHLISDPSMCRAQWKPPWVSCMGRNFAGHCHTCSFIVVFSSQDAVKLLLVKVQASCLITCFGTAPHKSINIQPANSQKYYCIFHIPVSADLLGSWFGNMPLVIGFLFEVSLWYRDYTLWTLWQPSMLTHVLLKMSSSVICSQKEENWKLSLLAENLKCAQTIHLQSIIAVLQLCASCATAWSARLLLVQHRHPEIYELFVRVDTIMDAVKWFKSNSCATLWCLIYCNLKAGGLLFTVLELSPELMMFNSSEQFIFFCGVIQEATAVMECARHIRILILPVSGHEKSRQLLLGKYDLQLLWDPGGFLNNFQVTPSQLLGQIIVLKLRCRSNGATFQHVFCWCLQIPVQLADSQNNAMYGHGLFFTKDGVAHNPLDIRELSESLHSSLLRVCCRCCCNGLGTSHVSTGGECQELKPPWPPPAETCLFAATVTEEISFTIYSSEMADQQLQYTDGVLSTGWNIQKLLQECGTAQSKQSFKSEHQIFLDMLKGYSFAQSVLRGRQCFQYSVQLPPGCLSTWGMLKIQGQYDTDARTPSWTRLKQDQFIAGNGAKQLELKLHTVPDQSFLWNLFSTMVALREARHKITIDIDCSMLHVASASQSLVAWDPGIFEVLQICNISTHGLGSSRFSRREVCHQPAVKGSS